MNRIFTRKGLNIIVLVVDILLVYASIFFAFYLCRDTLDAYNANYAAFIQIAPFIGVAYLIISHIFEIEKPKDFNILGVGYTVLLIVLCLALATMALSFLWRQFAYPRSILMISSGLQTFTLSMWHLFLNKKYLKSNVRKIATIIGHEKSKSLAYKLLTTNRFSAQIKHICVPTSIHIKECINQSEIIFITDDVEEDKKRELIKYCIMKNKELFYEPKNAEILLFNAILTDIDDSPALRVKLLGIGGESEILKRILDLFLGIIAAIIFVIPMIIISICLKIQGGSIFYQQERVTKHGRKFQIFKFRTMVENAEALSGPTLAQEKDNRITKLGHIMRITRLDEIPQIINILKGDMSIVGPRPERPFFVEQFESEFPEYAMRHSVKAGLTGLAQVCGKYNTSVRDKLKYDLFYINSYSFALDIKLIMQTLNILLRKNSTEGVKELIDIEKQIEDLCKQD